VVRDPCGADVAVAPRLPRRPFDRVVEVERFLPRAGIGESGRLTRASRIDAHARVATRHPPTRRHRFPVVVRIGFLFEIRRRNPYLVFLVTADVDQNGNVLPALGTKNVGVQDRPVAHRDRDVLLHDHRAAFGESDFFLCSREHANRFSRCFL
jgi:hypothetical protein